ncbi:hypothetical protein AX774_g556 [Zancudomyces culisetae]|uniref:Uncharacterized protein n=1 Tax=Zancudomyces culisetae TaxID=1213189 RepID=A0A1R1PY56_ZANCU|nr:hypothetical protein AX774_g556 [Zancudomyces culisetae]|eukprot:OMH85880.1 hypothetical protein AX774_g556 [Zancudomyces culisetae]
MVKKHVLDNVFCSKNNTKSSYNRPIISVNIFNDITEPFQVDCLIDIGSSENFIDINVAKKLKLLPSPLDIPFSIESIDGNMLSTTGINHVYNDIKVSIGNGHTENINLHPIQSVHGHVILGMPWLKKHNPSINWDTFDILFNSDNCLNNCVHHKRPVDIIYRPEVSSEDDKSEQNVINSDENCENCDQIREKIDDNSSYFGQNDTSESDTIHANTIMSKLKSYLFTSGKNVAHKSTNAKNKVENVVKKKVSREKNKVSDTVQTDDYSNYGYLLDHEMFSTPITDSADINEQKQEATEDNTIKNAKKSNKYDIEFDENKTSSQLNKLVQHIVTPESDKQDIYQRINTKNLRKNTKNTENIEKILTKVDLKNTKETSIAPETTNEGSTTSPPTTETTTTKNLNLDAELYPISTPTFKPKKLKILRKDLL